MPTLPNLGDIPQGQYDRIVAAFPGATGAQKVAAYRAWLTNRLIERVRYVETRKIDEQTEAAKKALLLELNESLPPMQPDPDLPPYVDPPVVAPMRAGGA
jgi:hypothetical protein